MYKFMQKGKILCQTCKIVQNVQSRAKCGRCVNLCKIVQTCENCARLCKMCKLCKFIQKYAKWCKIVQNVQNCAKRANVCKISKDVQNVQNCAKCTTMWKMCKNVQICAKCTQIVGNVQNYAKCTKFWKCVKFFKMFQIVQNVQKCAKYSKNAQNCERFCKMCIKWILWNIEHNSFFHRYFRSILQLIGPFCLLRYSQNATLYVSCELVYHKISLRAFVLKTWLWHSDRSTDYCYHSRPHFHHTPQPCCHSRSRLPDRICKCRVNLPVQYFSDKHFWHSNGQSPMDLIHFSRQKTLWNLRHYSCGSGKCGYWWSWILITQMTKMTLKTKMTMMTTNTMKNVF